MKSQVWSDMKSGQFLDFKSFYGNYLSNHNFVLSNQDGVLVGDMPFEVKRNLCSPDDDIHCCFLDTIDMYICIFQQDNGDANI